MIARIYGSLIEFIKRYSAASVAGKEDVANKVQTLASPNAVTYPSTDAVANAGYMKATLNGAALPALKIAQFTVNITALNQTVSYASYGFSALIGAPIITLVQPLTTVARAGFTVLHAYNTTQCRLSIAESRTVPPFGETLEYTTGTVSIVIFGI